MERDSGDVYEALRRRVTATVRSCDPAELDRVVPATPAWRVRDVLAHVVGLAADLNGSRFPGLDDDPAAWTAHQVDARRTAPLDALLAEWDREGPVFAGGLRLFGIELGAHFVADLHAHHTDVLVALGRAGDDDPDTVALALAHYAGFLHEQLVAAGWGAVELVVGDQVRRLGPPDAPVRARVGGAPLDLVRSLSGRRTLAQLRALSWDGEVDGFLAWYPGALAATGSYELPTVSHDPGPRS